MAKNTRVHAWDRLWEHTGIVTRVDFPDSDRTLKQIELASLINKFTVRGLNIEEVDDLAEIIRMAYDIGKTEGQNRVA